MKKTPFAALTAIVAALFVLVTAAPALAHDALKSSSPAKGAKVKSLDEVRLEFSAKVRMPFVIVRQGESEVQRGKPEVDGAVVTQAVEDDLVSGNYTIAYRVVSSDGHPIEGEIPFRLDRPLEPTDPPSSEAPTSPATPVETQAGPAASAPVSSAPVSSAPAALDADQASAAQDVTFPVWLIVVVGALVGIGIGFLLSARRKKP
ncbi:copper resistance protein CopC [Nonomuraea sp. NPDC050643]|uniref:copper resistance CopC family protein n=1 Tax=Nonomuraea sp. NPDC050643 TaxID=3155660 RepID=UPI0033CF2947